MDNNQNLDNLINDENPKEDSSDEAVIEETAPEELSDTADSQEIAPANDEAVNAPTEDGEKPATPKGFSIASSLYDYVEIFAIAVISVLLIFTFCIRLCRVDGDSMNNTLSNNEMIISSNLFYTPKQGDIIVFHLSNDYYSEPLVKRVIATEGQSVEINFTSGVIKVDGVVYNDEHAYLSGGKYLQRLDFNKEYIVKEGVTTYFRATVPEGCVFVLGDNRNGSSDSRTERVGFVDVDCILGKAILRLSPFTSLN